MKATLHKNLILLLGFGTVCERMCTCVQLYSLDAGRCLVWWGNWALPHSPSQEGTEHIYMVSCICKAAYWREDNLKKTVWLRRQHSAGPLECGASTLCWEAARQVAASPAPPTPGMHRAEWKGGGRVMNLANLGEGHCRCWKIKAKFFWVWLAVHWSLSKSHLSDLCFLPGFSHLPDESKNSCPITYCYCEHQMCEICETNRWHFSNICSAPGTGPGTCLLPHLSLTRTL